MSADISSEEGGWLNTSNSFEDSDKVIIPFFLLLLLIFLFLPPLLKERVGMRMLLLKGWPQRVAE